MSQPNQNVPHGTIFTLASWPESNFVPNIETLATTRPARSKFNLPAKVQLKNLLNRRLNPMDLYGGSFTSKELEASLQPKPVL